ncbi:hypothetical protein [Vibrio pectenicida]|uniref:Uncharacterized protein n=1 Tax=Vibrio pectenicida TaxID=62763 RepID=A0A427U4Z9_9VIBR|nr:hypothetical protein [Vibrio pectenicida]RSD31733.1 hypothetical protein EJA03_07350 [Vibrio pectenicida]
MNIRFLIALAMVGSSTNVYAKITYEDAIRHDKQMSEENSHTMLDHGFTNAELAIVQGSGKGGEAIFYTMSGGHNRTGRRALSPVSSHHCALSMIESNKDNHTRAEVYKSGGYWYMNVWSVGNGGYKTAKAMCWPRG